MSLPMQSQTPASAFGAAQHPGWQTAPDDSYFARRQQPRTAKDMARQHSASLSALPSSAAAAAASQLANRRRLSAAISDEGGNVKLTRTGRPSKALKGQAVHTCEDCGKVYTRAEHMRRHQRTHSQGLNCDVPGCDRSFNRSDMLQRHKEKHHNKTDARRQSVSSRGSHGRSSRSPMPAAAAAQVQQQQQSFAMRSPFANPQSQAFEVHGMLTPGLSPVAGGVMPQHGAAAAADQWGSVSLSPLPSAMVPSSLSYATAGHAEPYPGGYSYGMATPAGGTDSWYSPGLSSAPSPSLNSSSMPSAWGSSTSLSLPTATTATAWDNPTPFGTIDPVLDAMQPPPTAARRRDFDMFQIDGTRDGRFRKSSSTMPQNCE